MEEAVRSCNQTIKIIEDKIALAYKDLRELQLPKDGDFSIFRQMQLLKTRMQDEISFQKHNLFLAENALMKATQQLKTANIEFEKFKYLETTEIEKVIKALKEKEAKDLDEVALIAFNRTAANKKGKNIE